MGTSAQAGFWRRHGAGALLAGLALLCALAILFPGLSGGRVLAPPALSLPFVAIGVLLLPGYLLDELLRISGQRVSIAAPPLWFALSCALATPAAWLALGLHTSLRPLGFILSGQLVLLLIVWLIARGAPRAGVWEFSRRERWLGAAALLLLLTILALVIFWAPAGGSDYWTYRAYLREYVDSPAINQWDPFLGEGAPVTPRMRYQAWLVIEAFLAWAAGIEPAFALPELLDPFLAVFAILATYALARELLGSARRALAAAGLQMVAYLYLQRWEIFGGYLLARTAEDKTLGYLIFFPLLMGLVLRAVSERDRPAEIGIMLVALANAGAHGLNYALFLLACGLFLAALILLGRPRPEWGRLLRVILLVLPLALVVVMTALGAAEVGPAPGGVGWEAYAAARQAQSRVLYLGQSSLFVVQPRLVFNPVTLAGLLFTPLLYLARKRRTAAALLLGVQIGPLVLLFVPGLPNLIGRFLDYRVLYRLAWVSLPALTIAFVLADQWPRIAAFWRRAAARLSAGFPPARRLALPAALLLGTAFWLTLLPPTRSNFFPEDAGWLSAGLRQALEGAAQPVRQMGAPVVLADPADNAHIAAVWGLARLMITREQMGTQEHFSPQGQREALERLSLVNSLSTARADDAQFVARLQALGVNLIVLNRQPLGPAPAGATASTSQDQFPLSYLSVFENEAYVLYLVNLKGENSLAEVGRAQLALARGDAPAACARFARAREAYPTSPLALAGAGWCRELDGATRTARANYAQALAALQGGAWRPDWPAELQPWLDWRPALADALAQTIGGQTVAFLEERLAAIERDEKASAAGVTAWIGGWPRTAPVSSDEAHGRQEAALAQWLQGQLAADGRAPAADALRATSAALLRGADEAVGATLAGLNRLRNGDLEEGQLAGWNPTGDPPAGAVRTIPRAGADWAAEISIPSVEPVYRSLCQSVAVEPGRRYLYLLQAEADLGVGARAQIGYWDYGRFGALHPTVGFKTDRPFAWTPFWQMAQMPAGVKNISVCPVLLMASGTARFDRVWFIPWDDLAAAIGGAPATP